MGKAVSRGAWKVAPVQGVPGLQMKGQTEGVAAGGVWHPHTARLQGLGWHLHPSPGRGPPSPPTWYSGEAREWRPDPTPPHPASMVLAWFRQETGSRGTP